MGLTQAGPICDVCDMIMFLDKSINPFTLSCLPGQTLICHDKCRPAVEALMGKKAGDPEGWKDLPPGALRRGFEDLARRLQEIPDAE